MNKLTVSAGKLARLRKICLALPEASEKEAWGDPTFRVRDKIYRLIAPKKLAAALAAPAPKKRRRA